MTNFSKWDPAGWIVILEKGRKGNRVFEPAPRRKAESRAWALSDLHGRCKVEINEGCRTIRVLASFIYDRKARSGP